MSLDPWASEWKPSPEVRTTRPGDREPRFHPEVLESHVCWGHARSSDARREASRFQFHPPSKPNEHRTFSYWRTRVEGFRIALKPRRGERARPRPYSSHSRRPPFTKRGSEEDGNFGSEERVLEALRMLVCLAERSSRSVA
jgi:hypothetical protein